MVSRKQIVQTVSEVCLCVQSLSISLYESVSTYMILGVSLYTNLIQTYRESVAETLALRVHVRVCVHVWERLVCRI